MYSVSEFNLAQLRHLYLKLCREGRTQLATGLLGPIISAIEESGTIGHQMTREEKMRIARKVMDDNREVLKALAESDRS